MAEYIYEDDPRMKVYRDLVRYAKSNPGGHIKFLSGITHQLSEKGKITIDQLRVIQEIHERVCPWVPGDNND
jgi:hypothetical protein